VSRLVFFDGNTEFTLSTLGNGGMAVASKFGRPLLSPRALSRVGDLFPPPSNASDVLTCTVPPLRVHLSIYLSIYHLSIYLSIYLYLSILRVEASLLSPSNPSPPPNPHW